MAKVIIEKKVKIYHEFGETKKVNYFVEGLKKDHFTVSFSSQIEGEQCCVDLTYYESKKL